MKKKVRCLGPGKEHTFTSRNGERVCGECRKRIYAMSPIRELQHPTINRRPINVREEN